MRGLSTYHLFLSTVALWGHIMMCEASTSSCLTNRNITVELRATYPEQEVVPCTKGQTHLIQSLMQSILQVDAIAGMGVSTSLSELEFAWEAFGEDVTRILSPLDADNFPLSQQELSVAHMTTEDTLEDLYYQVTPSSNGNDNSNSAEQGQKDIGSAPAKEQDSVPPPPPLEPLEGSLRTNRQINSEKDTDSDGARKLALDTDLAAEGCSADMCTWFLSQPAAAAAAAAVESQEDESLCSEDDYQQRLSGFQNRVSNTLGKKLRKWARDSNVHCLGNSWELQVVVAATSQ
jgi:hypothetical protein